MMSKWADKWMSAAERSSDASNAELVNEWAERVNQRAEEQMQMAQYSTRQFQIISTRSGMGRYTLRYRGHEIWGKMNKTW